MAPNLIRRGLIAIAGAVTIALLVVAAAHLPFVRARVLDWARAQAAQRFGIVVEADGIRYNLPMVSVELRNPTFANERQPPFFRADSLRVVLNRSVLWGNVRVDELVLAGPRVAIVRHRDGTTNLPAGQREPQSTGSAPLNLGTIDLKRLTVEVRDESEGRTLSVGPIDLRLDSSPASPSPGEFGPSAFSVALSATGPASTSRSLSGTLGGRLGFDGARLSVPALNIESQEGRLKAAGWVDLMAESLNVNAQGTLDLDFARIGRFADLSEALAGSARAQFTVGGTLADPTVRFAVAGQDVGFRSIAGATLSARAAYGAGRVAIDALEVTSPVAAVSMTGEVAVVTANRPTGTSRIEARMTNVHLDPLLRSAGVAVPLPLGSTAEGVFNLTLDGTTALAPGWLQHLTALGSARTTPSGEGLSLDGQVNVRLEDASWTLTHEVRSTTGQASLAGEVSGRFPPGASDPTDSTLSGDVELRLHNLAALNPLLKQAGVDLPSSIDGRVKGALVASIVPGGTLASPRVQATISGDAIQVRDLLTGELRSTIAIDRQALRAQSFEAHIGQTSLLTSGNYTWAGNIEGQFTVTAQDLGELARTFDLTAVSPTGLARLEGTVQGNVRSPRSRSRLEATSVSIDGIPIGGLSATLDLADWQVNVDARATDFNTNLRGVVDTREPFAYRAEATLSQTSIPALIPMSLRSSIPISEGAVTATLRVQGVAQRPLESTGEVSFQQLAGTASGVPFRLDAPATIAVGPDIVTATPILLQAGNETQIRLRGALARAQPREGLEVHLNSTVTELLAFAAPAIPDWQLSAGESQIDLDIRVGGTIRAPEPDGTISLQAGALTYGDLPSLTNVTLQARIDRAQISLQSLAATWQGAQLLAEGIVPLRMIVPEPAPNDRPGSFGAWRETWLTSLPDEPSSATLRASVTNATTGLLAAFVDPSQLQEVEGKVAVTVTAEADSFAVDGVRAEAVFDEASLTLAEVPFTQTLPTRFRLEDGFARIESLRLNAQGNEISASGGVNLIGSSPTLDLELLGDVDLRIFGAFVADMAPGGLGGADITVRGPLADPEVAGSVSIAGGELRVDAPPVAASDFDGVLSIAGDRTASIALEGLINGGSATVAGNVSLKEWSDPRGGATLTARNVMLDYPDGFQTESNADLTLTLAGLGSTLSGRVEVLNGTYREPIVFSRGLLTGLTRSDVVSTSSPSPFLTNLRLDVAVQSTEAVRIDNNYGRLSLAADLTVTGSAERPGVVGRIEALPDGEIYLLGNTYRVQNLVVDLANPVAIAPELTFLAETRVNNVPVEVALQCTATGACEREVRSQLTGVTNEQAEAMLFGISTDPADAGAQLARLLSGEVLGIVGQRVGLDTLRLEVGSTGRSDLFDDPSLLAGDVNPASRLTFGKRIGERVELAYSQDLAENGFTTSTSFFAPAGISLRALLLDDQSRSYEFRHEPRFSGPRRQEPRLTPRPTIAAVRIAGAPGFPESELRDRLRLAEGDRYDFVRWQEDRERLKALYQSRGFFEATVRARRLPAEPDNVASGSNDDAAGEQIVLEYTIERGRPTRLDVSGVNLPPDMTNRIVERWAGAIFDRFLERDVTLMVREHLYDAGRPHAKVVAAMQVGAADGAKTLRIDVDPGPSLTPRLEFEGNSQIATASLADVTRSAGPATAWLDPPFVKLAVERLYQEHGLLSAEVSVTEPEVRDGLSIVRLVIREGQPWQIRRVTLGGAELLNGGARVSQELQAGTHYDPKIVTAHVAALEQRFRAAGFLDVRVVAETVLDDQARVADVHVLAAPGPRSVLSSIVIEGAEPDDPPIARNLKLAVGPVDAGAVGDARRRLYDTGLYRRVEIELEPVGGAEPPPGSPDAHDRQVVARVRVEERPRYAFRYGFQLNDEVVGADERTQRFGFSADLETRNVAGLGATVGLSARLRRDQQIGRVFVGANRFFGLPLRSNLFLSRGREEIGSEDTRTVSHVTEVSFEQTYRLRRWIDLRYGYGFGRNTTTFTGTGSDFDLSVKVARFTTSGLVDRRSDPFDPAGGWFSSATLETSRPGIGSDISFLKGFLQYFHFVPIGDNLLVASAARIGLARTFRDEDLIPSERFFAGGATSVRGYRQDDLGPRGVFGDAEGGRALVVGNSELRFPVYRWLKGVGFIDFGNVYETVGDIDLSNVQVGAGAGIRLDTPIGLLRLDVAAPTNRRPFDPTWTAYFGLGHAF